MGFSALLHPGDEGPAGPLHPGDEDPAGLLHILFFCVLPAHGDGHI